MNRSHIFILVAASIVLLVIFSQNPTGLATGYVEIRSTVGLLNSTLNATPLLIEVNVTQGTTETRTFSITSEGPGNTGLNITMETSGAAASFITLNETFANLSSLEIKTISFNITIPLAQGLGYYYAFINVTDHNNVLKDINVTINVLNVSEVSPPAPAPTTSGAGTTQVVIIKQPEQPLVFDTV